MTVCRLCTELRLPSIVVIMTFPAGVTSIKVSFSSSEPVNVTFVLPRFPIMYALLVSWPIRNVRVNSPDV